MRGLVNVLLLAAIAFGAIAAVVLWPKAFEGVLPASVLEDIAGATASSVPDAPDAPGAPKTGDTPADFLIDGADGLVAEGPIAAMAGNAPVFISDVITGYSTEVAGDVPAEITTIRPIMGCLLTPPLTGTSVGYVVAGQSGLALDLLSYGDSDLATAVQAFVDTYRASGPSDTAPVAVSVPDDLFYQAYDVVVTETTAPVYLILQTGPGLRIWNIHTAEGVRIERVVLLGGGQVGVANLDPVVPVEVILQDGLQACGITPVLPLNAGHELAGAAASGDVSAKAQLDARELAANAYGQWFMDSFGVAAASSRVGFDRGTVSLVGPVPGGAEPEVTPKATYAPIGGSKIRTTQDTFFEIPGQVAAGEDFASRVTSIATAFAYGDLANLRQGADF